MNAISVFFYFGSALVIIFAILSVTSGRLLRSAIYLLFVLVGIAVFYLVLDYMFLAAVQVVVYMGGIVVLIIFSILLTSHISERLQRVSLLTITFSAGGVLIGAGVVISVIAEHVFKTNTSYQQELTVKQIGESLLSVQKFGYVLPFEVISILLLAAMVAAIVIAKREKHGND